jgi:hypothetical protein
LTSLRARLMALRPGVIATIVAAVPLAAIGALWTHFDWAEYPSPPSPNPNGPRHQAELVVMEVVGGMRNRWRGAYRHRVILPSGGQAYITTRELLPKGEHLMAEFTPMGGDLLLLAYRRCGLAACRAE